MSFSKNTSVASTTANSTETTPSTTITSQSVGSVRIVTTPQSASAIPATPNARNTRIITAPQLIDFEPAAATPGTTVTIQGVNFDPTTNNVYFGTSDGRYTQNGVADNLIATIGSSNGTAISFTVPNSGPSGMLCNAQKQCIAVTASLLQSGRYPVVVKDAYGTSNTLSLTVTQ